MDYQKCGFIHPVGALGLGEGEAFEASFCNNLLFVVVGDFGRAVPILLFCLPLIYLIFLWHSLKSIKWASESQLNLGVVKALCVV